MYGSQERRVCFTGSGPQGGARDPAIGGRLVPLFDQRIDAPCTTTSGNQPQIYVAKNHRFLAAIVDGEEAARRPGSKIRHRHLAAQDESRGSRKQTHGDEQTADQFNRAGQSVKLREIVVDSAARKSPQLLGSMLHEEQTSDDSQDAQ